MNDHFGDCANAVFRAASSIPNAGQGLFANRDLPAGTIVSWYPVHGFWWGDENGWDMVTLDGHEFDSSGYSMFLLGNRDILGYESLGSGELFIDADPNRQSPAAWQAHYLNDGSCMMDKNTDESVKRYYETSYSRQNVLLLPVGPAPLIAAVTTRSVRAGEELHTCYGYSYWFAYLEASGVAAGPVISSEVEQMEADMGNFMASLTLRTAEAHQDLFGDLRRFLMKREA